MIKMECAKSLLGVNLSVDSNSHVDNPSSKIATIQPQTSQTIDKSANRLKVDATALVMVTVVPFFPATTIAFSWLNALSTAISFRRQQLLQEHSTQMKTIVTFLSRAWKMDTVKAAKAVWRTGGGQKNIAWTLTVMAALTLVLLRPFLYAVSGDAASAIRSAL
jgi:hypothetical protein